MIHFVKFNVRTSTKNSISTYVAVVGLPNIRGKSFKLVDNDPSLNHKSGLLCASRNIFQLESSFTRSHVLGLIFNTDM